MSFIDSLQGKQKYQLASNANININLGPGNSNITAKGNDVNIDTKCGDQNIDVNAKGDMKVHTGDCGTDKINAVVVGNATIVTNEDDDEVSLVCGGNFDITAGIEHHTCETGDETFSDNDTVKVISTSTEGLNKIKAGKGDDKITVIANNVDLDKGTGSMLLGALGNNYDIDSAAEKNIIGFYGNNYDIDVTAATSQNDIRTLDFWMRDGEDGKKIELNDGSTISLKDAVDDVKESKTGKEMTLTEYDAKNNADNVKYFKDTFGDMFDQLTYQGTRLVSEVTTSFVEHESVTANNKKEIADKYNLSDSERKILESVDLTKTLAADGKPLYAIAKSPKKGVYVVVKRDGVNHSRAVNDNECIAFYANESTAYNETTTKTDTYTVRTTKTLEDLFATTGVSNVSITQNNGSLNAFMSVLGGKADITKGKNCDNEQVNNITVVGGHVDSKTTSTSTDEKDIKTSTSAYTGSVFISHGKTWTSPLVLDMNKDGKVSSATGEGVDVDGDGKADGAAAKGDKMLAMSDMNGNGKIDGNEVFGDQTVSPFTGKKLNAANGFEALKMIAQEAQQKTGKAIITNGEVNIALLQEALATVGVNLGLISDGNVTTLESAADVKSINVERYINNDDASDGIQQRQLGTFTDAAGNKYSANDVWYGK